MKSKFLKSIMLSFVFFGAFNILDAEINKNDYSIEKLEKNAWTDFVYSFKQLFGIYEVRSILELGIGEASRYFLEHSQEVKSVELLVSDRWNHVVPNYIDCLDAYKDYPKWDPSIHLFSDIVNQANEISIQNLNPGDFEVKYQDEIKEFISSLFEEKNYDIVFVNPRMHLRADIINALFGKADIIVAHDTNGNALCYGWARIESPNDYELVHSYYGQGTTFWIKKNKIELLNNFFPD